MELADAIELIILCVVILIVEVLINLLRSTSSSLANIRQGQKDASLMWAVAKEKSFLNQ